MTLDPFAILGLAARFDLSQAEIDRAFLRRVAAVHPDADRSVNDESDDGASDLNWARAQLIDPASRAESLLRHLGGKSASEDPSLPKGFLAQTLALREEVEEALAADTDGSGRTSWQSQAQHRLASHVARLCELFAATSTAALADIRTELNAMRYTQRLIEQLDPAYRPGDEAGPRGGGPR